MRIENLSLQNINDRVRASATIIWEDCGRPEQEIFFETPVEFADGFTCNPHAFLVACILPAFRFGEKRVYLNEDICPELKDGLITVMSWMRHWYYEPTKALVNIEARNLTSLPELRKQRAGLFFSGGIDSLATLRANRINYPPEHPGSIKDGLVVCGLEVYDPQKFGHVVGHLSEISKDASMTLIPVFTNIREVGPEDAIEFWSNFWVKEFEGAAFSAVAHAFSKRLSTVYYSSSYDIPNIFIWGKCFFTGSHPLIDPNYSSSDLSIKHYGISMSRFEKTKLIADWDVALKHLRVCNKSMKYESHILNCGECEKCLRTKLALSALGVLSNSAAFSNNDISVKLLQKNIVLSKPTFNLYEEMIEPLTMEGYHDFAHIIKQKIARKKFVLRTVEPIKDYDRKYFRGTLLKLKRIIYKKGISY